MATPKRLETAVPLARMAATMVVQEALRARSMEAAKQVKATAAAAMAMTTTVIVGKAAAGCVNLTKKPSRFPFCCNGRQ